MKTFKDYLKEKGISEEEFAKKSVDEKADLQASYNQEIISALKAQVEKAATQDAVDAIKNQIDIAEKNNVSCSVPRNINNFEF